MAFIGAATALFGVQADAAELALDSGADGGVEEGVGATGTVASTSSFVRGRILTRKGRRMSAGTADFSGLRLA